MGGSGGSLGPSGEPRSLQVGSQEGSFWGPETLLGRLEGLLGASSVWEFDLEASWGGSGGSLGPSGEPGWLQVGSQEGGFWGPETKRKWLHYWEPLAVDIFMIFHEFRWIFGRQNGAKLVSNWSAIKKEHEKGCF